MPSGATMSNAYRARKGDRDAEAGEAFKVPQSFTFMPREGQKVSTLFEKHLAEKVLDHLYLWIKCQPFLLYGQAFLPPFPVSNLARPSWPGCQLAVGRQPAAPIEIMWPWAGYLCDGEIDNE